LKNHRSTIDSSFLRILLELTKTRLTGHSTGSSQKNLLLGDIKRFGVIVPPNPKQQRFAALVEKVDLLRVKQRQSGRELENLFQSLMQRAFRGELVS
jgi:type I restriction enzyme S subunit